MISTKVPGRKKNQIVMAVTVVLCYGGGQVDCVQNAILGFWPEDCLGYGSVYGGHGYKTKTRAHQESIESFDIE